MNKNKDLILGVFLYTLGGFYRVALLFLSLGWVLNIHLYTKTYLLYLRLLLRDKLNGIDKRGILDNLYKIVREDILKRERFEWFVYRIAVVVYGIVWDSFSGVGLGVARIGG